MRGFVALLLASPLLVAASPCASSDGAETCTALTELWFATGGASWTNAAWNLWLTPSSFCTWSGVECALNDHFGDGLEGGVAGPTYRETVLGTGAYLGRHVREHIVALRLAHNNLQNELPDSFAPLQSLKELDLGDNHLSGTIPPTVLALTSILSLNLAGNAIEVPRSIAEPLELKGFTLQYGDDQTLLEKSLSIIKELDDAATGVGHMRAVLLAQQEQQKRMIEVFKDRST